MNKNNPRHNANYSEQIRTFFFLYVHLKRQIKQKRTFFENSCYFF